MFHDAYTKYSELIVEDQMCFILGKNFNGSETGTVSRISANKIYKLNNLRKTLTKNINIRIDFYQDNKEILDQLQTAQGNHPGHYNVILHLVSKHGRIQQIILPQLKLSCDEATLLNLRNIIGNKNIWLSL